MGLNKDQLIYDPTDNESDTVGAYMLASDGTELTHTGGALDVNIASGVDFDVRDLDSAQDNIEIQTAAGQALDIDASGFLTSKISDGTDSLAIEADGSINVNAVFGGFTTFLNPTIVTVGAVAAQLNASILAGRSSVIYQNTGNQALYLGNSGVTTANGLKLPKGSSVELSYGDSIDMYAVGTVAGGKIRAFEAA